ncbi:molybdate ABC transporter substrate-binding protein [Dietzia sp.]|uniref:molybdate ABC transporter substrate-binding protein n=1 Tax=Dietzia sp. TaxID=1871616 RepID=UPI002FD955D8
MQSSVKRAGAVLAATAVLAAGCSSNDSGSDGDSNGDSGTTSIRIGAAASLTDVLPQLIEKFNEQNPDVKVDFEPGGSPTLVSQLLGGAPYNLVMLASESSIKPAIEAGAVAENEIFAKNVPQIAVPKDNPAHVENVRDLARDGVRVALCEVKVPCGEAAQKVLDADGVQFDPVTRENDVTTVLTRVRTGEVDAGMVYRTDVASAKGDVEGIDVENADSATTKYPVALTSNDDKDQKAKDASEAFKTFLLGPDGQKILADAGFLSRGN